MINFDILVQIFWTGLATSTYSVLFAIAFALILRVVKVWNFAQAGFMGIAFYTIYLFSRLLDLPFLVGLAIALIVTTLFSIAFEVYGLQTFRRRNSPHLTYFIFTLMFSELMQYIISLIFGTEPVSLIPSLMSPSIIVSGIIVSHWDLKAIGTTIILLLGLYLLITKTPQGKYMLATADNPQLARLYGINIRFVYIISFIIASVLICAGVALFGTRAAIVPTTFLDMMVFAVIAVLLGGIGNIPGAAIAAVVLNLIRSFSIIVIPSAWQSLILYALLFITILFFPRGVRLSNIKNISFFKSIKTVNVSKGEA